MAAENTNSRPDEEDYDRDISTSTENDNIMMNDITAQEGRENMDFTTNIENESITSDTTTEKQRKQHTDPDITPSWSKSIPVSFLNFIFPASNASFLSRLSFSSISTDSNMLTTVPTTEPTTDIWAKTVRRQSRQKHV